MNMAPLDFLHLFKSYFYSKEIPESFNLKFGIIHCSDTLRLIFKYHFGGSSDSSSVITYAIHAYTQN